MEKQKFYLPLERLQKLQESVGFLDSYKTNPNEIHHIGPNINTENMTETNLLRELGKLNVRREEIIKQLMGTK